MSLILFIFYDIASSYLFFFKSGGRDDGMILLDKVFRQQNDSVFLNILNDLRMGVVTPQAQKILGGKVQQSYLKDREAKAMNVATPAKVDGNEGTDCKGGIKIGTLKKKFVAPKEISVRPTKLFSTNKDVDAYNAEELNKLAEQDPDGEHYRYEPNTADFISIFFPFL